MYMYSYERDIIKKFQYFKFELNCRKKNLAINFKKIMVFDFNASRRGSFNQFNSLDIILVCSNRNSLT